MCSNMTTLILGVLLLSASVAAMSVEGRNDEIRMTPSSITRDARRKERLLQIKSELEEKLGGGGRRSNITRDQLPASLLEELRRNLQEPPKPIPEPMLQDMIIFPDNGGGNCMENSGIGSCLTWTIPRSLKYAENELVTANMKLYKRVNDTEPGQLEVAWKNFTVAVEPPTLTSTSGWINFDISEVVRAAAIEEQEEVNLWVSCPKCTNGNVVVMTETSYRPYITVTTHSGIEADRRKRHVVTCRQRPHECCIQEWYVTFEELDMDWVIEPRGFYANFCAGNCLHDADFSKLMQSSDHSYILYKAARKTSWKVENLKPCCSATETSSLRIFEAKEDKLLLRTLKDMRVEACGCF